LVAAAKVLVAATKKLFVVPNFVAVTKPFFPRDTLNSEATGKLNSWPSYSRRNA